MKLWLIAKGGEVLGIMGGAAQVRLALLDVLFRGRPARKVLLLRGSHSFSESHLSQGGISSRYDGCTSLCRIDDGDSDS